MIMTEIAIIGAGMAGFGAAHWIYQQGIKATIYEKNAYYGGHAATFIKSGFVFDDGPHISFTKNERLQALFAQSVANKYELVKASTNNYWKGFWIKHPAQCNLYRLPVELIVDIISDFIQKDANTEIRSYKDWLYAHFGKTFAEMFPMQYTRKFHTTSADAMATNWIGCRLYQPDLKEMLHGALSPSTPDVHYVDHFRYPSKGGFIRFLDIFLNNAQLQLNREITRIDLRRKALIFADGKKEYYDLLVSSAPLTELIPMINDVPDTVRQAAKRLACSSCVLVNIGIDRADISKSQWTYFYDDDFIFTRLSFPHMLSSNNVPKGAGSIQAEIYYSRKYKPLERKPDDCILEVVSDLKRCGLLADGDKILYSESRVVPYANVIFDLDREPALKIIHDYLDDVGIGHAGRYGQWGYHWTDESFMSGEKAAQAVLNYRVFKS